jgi:hypothetical protein
MCGVACAATQAILDLEKLGIDHQAAIRPSILIYSVIRLIGFLALRSRHTAYYTALDPSTMLRQAVSDHYLDMLPLQKLLVKLFPEQKDFKISVCS